MLEWRGVPAAEDRQVRPGQDTDRPSFHKRVEFGGAREGVAWRRAALWLREAASIPAHTDTAGFMLQDLLLARSPSSTQFS